MFSWRSKRPLDKEERELIKTFIDGVIFIASMIAVYFIACAAAPRP
jgi:hypothetical protein